MARNSPTRRRRGGTHEENAAGEGKEVQMCGHAKKGQNRECYPRSGFFFLPDTVMNGAKANERYPRKGKNTADSMVTRLRRDEWGGVFVFCAHSNTKKPSGEKNQRGGRKL